MDALQHAQLSAFDLFGLAVAVVTAVALLQPRVRHARAWRATVTPLASIIGSGFLVVAPLLAHVAGGAATGAMVGIIALSFWIGSAIRYNILNDGQLSNGRPSGAGLIERLSDLSLACAYVISVAFYIRLLAAFVIDITDLGAPAAADALASVILVFIAAYGYRLGLSGLESLEEYSVTIKLSIIAALLVWLLHHDLRHGYDLAAVHAQPASVWERLRVLAGMILVVQGFETSKYLGSTYPADVRVRTMTLAQIIAALVYVCFVALVIPLAAHLEPRGVSETALIALVGIVTPILPLMLVVAAVMSQFSAAIADTLGAGGIVHRESRHRIRERTAYPLIVGFAVALIWVTNVFQLVSLASRAFAVFYLLQAVLAVRHAWHLESGHVRAWRTFGHGLLAVLMLLVIVFGKAAEG